ncbi:hypothetical protein GYMLUDRAFT_57897 [Collybiopsis luxurians FD-317 M1]|uniref:Ribosome assembly protein 3 n=1 Tax=Collybiopsis luxurians FD-317 M1 TaxID=944289 RepID=A0A0D0CJZ3_9AGAR|nr:hypothetical protein GYMLUDRAFT_57897 [Collybiopsis luxurians FD-317 M1]
MPVAGAAPRKRPNRNRKRKRRAVSVSSSSSDDSSSSSDSDNNQLVIKRTVPLENNAGDAMELDDPSSSSSDPSTSSSDDDDDDETMPIQKADVEAKAQSDAQQGQYQSRPRSPSPGPIPPSTARIPSFLPEKTESSKDLNINQATGEEKESEQALREKFTKFWMNSIVDGFKDDLEVIRKDPASTTSKLSMLIDSLAAGAEVYTSPQASQPSKLSTASGGRREVTDMEIVLGE